MINLDIYYIISLVIILIISVVGHEIAHGFVAFKFGDETAKNAKRLSLNPIKHVDILGTIIIPSVLYMTGGIIFGWAKPVPVDIGVVIRNRGYFGAICVSLAGIVYNILLALISFLLIKSGVLPEIILKFIITLLMINLILAIFNLYPIPPLDGSHALSYIFRIFGFHKFATFYDSLNRYGFIILIILIISPFKNLIFMPIYSTLDVVKNMII